VHRTQPVETRRRNVNVSLETSLADADRSLLTGTFSVSTERERRCSIITRTGSSKEGKTPTNTLEEQPAYFSTFTVTSTLTTSPLTLSLAATNCLDSPSLSKMEFV